MTKIRCAVYTRKSSESGLEQGFNSLDAQREAGEAYIKSQKHENWILNPKQYNDGGFSGGNMDRPALKQLLNDIRANKIDVVVVYKVDRLSRSLHDFAKLVAIFDENDVTFVSVTQSFNTKDSMGRLTLNMLLSFAQFEREVTGERIRDKIAASRKKGIWMGGNPPLGYDIIDRKLVVNYAEADTVRRIFNGYLECRSVIKLLDDLKAEGITGKTWTPQSGNIRHGKPFDRGKLYQLLHKKVYIGESEHRGQSYPGEHDAIIDPELFDRVREKLKSNSSKSDSNHHKSKALLKGFLFDPEGRAYSPSYTVKKVKSGSRYHRYYVSQQSIKGSVANHIVKRVSQKNIEEAVLKCLTDNLTDVNMGLLLNDWADKSYTEKRQALKAMLKSVTLYTDKIRIDMKEGSPFEMDVEFRKYGGKKVITDQRGNPILAQKTNKDPALIKALARAHKWDQMLEKGEAAHLTEIAKREEIGKSYIEQVYRLIFLSPEIKGIIIEGLQPPQFTLTSVLNSDIPLCWKEQKALYGL